MLDEFEQMGEGIVNRAKASGYSLTYQDKPIVLGMVGRGDRHHDIAAWFGVNQGRITEVKNGSHGPIAAAPLDQLPPRGPPGIKGRHLRESIEKAVKILERDEIGPEKLVNRLRDALAKYDLHEA